MKFPVATLLLAVMATKVRAEKQTCDAKPDPHFRTWDQKNYDYHGGCDLVLIQNPTFEGVGLDLHIRTIPFNAWGGISNAALQIGPDLLEVLDDGNYYFNSVLNDPLSTMGPNPHAITYTTIVSGGSTQSIWEVALDNMQYVRMVNYDYGGSTGGSISVEVYADSSDFGDSVGMCGTWGTPGLIARDGATDFQSAASPGNSMGLEWQVDLPLEPQLFQINPTLGPCAPGPEGEKDGDEADAANDCADLEGEDFNNCVFDVLATGNTAWADAPLYEYHKSKCVSDQRRCRRKRGKCVLKKECDEKTHFCNPKLCYANELPPWLDVLNDVDSTQPAEFRDPCVCAIPKKSVSGQCCHYTGPTPYNCAAIELLGPGADIDGRCNHVNMGDSCSWDYTDPECCEIAMNDANCKLPTDEAVEQCKCALEKKMG